MKLLIVFLVLIAAAGAGYAQAPDPGARIAASAIELTTRPGVYDPAYQRLDYPGGDVAPGRGVCSDVVIRALRAAGFDLQALVHEDMKTAFAAYPKRWGLKWPDANIDHRRVPNLETWFTRAGWRLPPSRNATDFLAGDIVSWNLKGDAGNLPHIGVVTGRIGQSGRPLIAHDIGAGPKLEDVLFNWPMTGHFRPQTD